MNFQNFYDQEEWLTLQFGIMWVFRGVAGADGRIDKDEQRALTIVVDAADKFNNSFISELLSSMKTNPGQLFRLSINDPRDFKKGLAEVAEILDQKASGDDALLYKKIITAVGIYVANSSGEMGEKNISEEEVNILSKLSHYLRLSTSDIRSEPNIESIIRTMLA